MLFLYTAHFHAKVFGGAEHNDSFCPDEALYGIGNLRRHAFLYLQTTCVGVDQTRKFAQTHYFAVGDVAYRHGSEERQDVVLAQGVELDVLHHHHLRAFVLE